MKITQAIYCCLDYHRMNSNKNTVRNYKPILTQFDATFPHRELESITSEEILSFLNQMNFSATHSTKRLRYSLLKAFYNFCKNTFDETIHNPCVTAMLRKMFRDRRGVPWTF